MLRTTRLVIACAAAFTVAGVASAAVPQGYPSDYQATIDAATKEGKVVVYSTTDTKAATPLVKDFETLYPGIKVEYNDLNSTELYSRFISEQAANATSADVVWSSAMDSTMKMATSFSLTYKSPEIDKLPKWAVWKRAAYGTTYEPAVFVYNKRLLAQEEVPTSHKDLAKLVSTHADKFKNKVTTYDIEKSAVGFMLAVQDSRNDPQYFEDMKKIGAGGLVLQSSTGTMMERVSSGENLIGYNILGGYAEARAKTDPSIGVSYPTDYALVLSRVAFINKAAKNKNSAKLWLDYLLSKRGQDILANKADLASVRDDIDGDNDVDGMTKKLGAALKPIPVDESLLDYLEQNKRLEFIKQWRTATGK